MAKHRTKDEYYAVKAIDKAQLLKDADGLRMLGDEIEILRRLHHQCIIKLYEVYENKACVYLVLEYVAGGELTRQFQQRQVYTEKEVAHAIKCVLQALAYCHMHNAIHRDVKLENLLFAYSSVP